MARNGSRGNAGGPSINNPTSAVGSAENRFLRPHQRRQRWGHCWVRLSCFGSQNRTKRIVPSSRASDAANRLHGGAQPGGMSNQTTTVTPLLAPPSSPASFTNSALHSTVQSPNCFLSLSANSPGGPSSTMFAIGPYANETQLVSPPVFSTYTTEPSTAPLTPPPELAHLTTPSSPDVPYAHYLSSSLDLRNAGKENGLSYVSTRYTTANDLRVTYPLYPESPASSLISPMSVTPRTAVTPRTGQSSPFPERETPAQWDALASANNLPHTRCRSWKFFGVDTSASEDFRGSRDYSFYPAQFHLDQAQLSCPSYPPPGGRVSISWEGNKHNKVCKQDVEEIEAYRASFGFSADELVNAPSYVEISDAADISFSLPAFAHNHESCSEQHPAIGMSNGLQMNTTQTCLMNSERSNMTSSWADLKLPFLSRDSRNANGNYHALTDEILLPKMRELKVSRSSRAGLSSSDAEIDYRRSTSSRNTSTQFQNASNDI